MIQVMTKEQVKDHNEEVEKWWAGIEEMQRWKIYEFLYPMITEKEVD